jgi:hypothetical protein
LLIASVFLLLATSPVSSAAPTAIDAGARSGPTATVRAAAHAPSAGRTVVVAGPWKSFVTFLENTLNSRRRMLQFGILGMCLALYIMIWRR